ncbi:MAG TPA: hypothetical protein VHZ74_03130 [Bryobacteraceae bacterium]|jgi:hypothetical protein|nr:hypothetical protein [Bryobacteraceae bacterium]
MTAKSLLIVGALGLATMGIASAKSYDVVLASPAKAGTTELKAGEYKLKVEGTQATFTDVQTSKSVTAPVKVGSAPQKFAATTVETSAGGGDMDNIKAIDLGGSTMKLEFGQ